VTTMNCMLCPVTHCDGDCARWNRRPKRREFTSQYLEDMDSAGLPGAPGPRRRKRAPQQKKQRSTRQGR
jgi:hypothetical protein